MTGSRLRIFRTVSRMLLSVFGIWLVNRRSSSRGIRTIIQKIDQEFSIKSL